MIGLKLIRQRCNYTIGSFAKELGVSRQIISEWELGNKEIPPQRKNEISELLGISQELLGPITKEQKDQLINKSMFAYNDSAHLVFISPTSKVFVASIILRIFIFTKSLGLI